MTTSPLLRAAVPAAALAVLLVGCGSDRDDRSAASSTTTTSTAPASTTAAPQPTTAPAPTTAEPQTTTSAAPTEAPPEAPPGVPVACGNADLGVAAGPVTETDTVRRVDVTFTNTSAAPCVLVGYPGADLVSAAGGVLVHVARRPANAAPHLELQPGEVATADVQASAIDSSTGTACGRTGTLTVTAPNTTESHLLAVNLPICDATISSVG